MYISGNFSSNRRNATINKVNKRENNYSLKDHPESRLLCEGDLCGEYEFSRRFKQFIRAQDDKLYFFFSYMFLLLMVLGFLGYIPSGETKSKM